MVIPEQLREEQFLRIQCKNPNNQKAAKEKGWPDESNYSFQEFQEKFPDDTSYGVLCGNNNLMVLDCDNSEIQDQLLQIPEIRETFTVQTAGKGLYHFYFHVTNIKNPKGYRADIKDQRVFDLQGARTYVLGPNSTLLSGKRYEIVNPRKIASIDYFKLKNYLSNILPNLKIINPTTKTTESSPTIDFDEVCVEIKNRIKPHHILPAEISTEPGENTECPLGHTSEGGKCFTHNPQGLWHCFHCGKGGNVIQLYQYMHDCSFLEAKRALSEMAGLDDEFKKKVLTLYAEPKTKHLASEELAKETIKLNKIVSIRNDKEPEMWIYKNGIYVPFAKTYVQEFIRSVLGPLYTTTFANRVITKIEADTYRHQTDFFINEDLTKIPVINGVLDITTNNIEPFSDKYTFFNKLPIVYDPLIKPEKTISFIQDIVKDKDNVHLIQELFGYLLHREYNIEKAFMLLGPGRNGKGKLLGLIEHFVGDQNCLSLSLQEITKQNSYDTEKLFGKYANLGGDIPKTKITDTTKLRSFTGRDSVTCMRKFLSPIKFVNFAKFIFACNELPTVGDDSDGFFDRWVRIDFPFKFVNDPQPNTNQKQIDVNILKSITTEKEMSGLLNWALIGLKRLQENQQFTETDDNKFTRSKWADTASSFSAFLTSEIELAPENGCISVHDMNRAYVEFCIQHKLQPDKLSDRKESLTKLGAIQGTKTINYKKYRVYNYIKFKNGEHNHELNEANALENQEELTIDGINN